MGRMAQGWQVTDAARTGKAACHRLSVSWLAMGAVLLLSACAVPIARPTGPGPVGQAEGRWRQQAHWVPMQDRDGTPRLLYARVCRPEGDGPARVLVTNHGTGPNRLFLHTQDCNGETLSWFLQRGFMVVQPLRRGYGVTGGRHSEVLDVVPGGLRTCDDLHPAPMALEAARDVAATVDYATALPGARLDGAVVLGVSTGGYAAVAYNSQAHSKVAAVVNVSGGIGGRFGGAIAQLCHAERMVEGARKFGATAVVPMLWLYATNDPYFPPDLGRAMFAAYSEAGGKGELAEPGVYESNGHLMFFGLDGSRLWGPPLERYLVQQGMLQTALHVATK